MASISRRDAGKILLAGCAGALVPAGKLCGATKINSVFRGVQIGVQTSTFRNPTPIPLDDIIAMMRKVGVGEVELWQVNLMGGQRLQGEELTKWRLETPASHFAEARKKFDDAGIALNCYNPTFGKGLPDEVFDHIFMQAKALGVKYIGASGTDAGETPRIDKFAQKYKIYVGIHNHGRIPGEYTSRNLESTLEGRSPWIGISLDAGHFVAYGGGDPIAFINKYHSKMFDIHLKDRKANTGDGGPGEPDNGQGGRYGTGDSHIADILRLVRDNKWKIPCRIELEYMGLLTPPADIETEFEFAFDFCKKTLES